MLKHRIATVFLTLMAVAPAWSASALEITYLGNEGFLLVAGQQKVLIDALQGDGLTGYVTLDEEPRKRLETASSPFDGVALVLATHAHGDHFDPHAVARYLEHNKKATFVSTEQALESLYQEITAFEKLKPRLQGHAPAQGKRVRLEIAGIPLQLFQLRHGDMQHLGIILELGGRRVLHIGDTESMAADFRRVELTEESIDLAFVPYWYFQYFQWKSALEDGIQAKQLVAMHLPAADAPKNYFGKAEGLDDLIEQINAEFPEVTILRDPLARKKFFGGE